MKLYHLSEKNLDKKTLQPKVPSNFLTKNGYEDNNIKRVCFSTNIDGCLRGLSQNLTGKEFYVHIPDKKYDIYKPTIKEVPDCKVTNEVWIQKPVKLKCIGKIYVEKDSGEDGIPYTYGNNTAELYDWDWKWVERISESNMEFKYSEQPDFIKEMLPLFEADILNETYLDKFYEELKIELESNDDGCYIITPSNSTEELDKAYEKYNSQSEDQKHKADTRSLALYGMTNYDHYHIQLAKLSDKESQLSYNHHDELIVKEDGEILPDTRGSMFDHFDIPNIQERIEKAKEHNSKTPEIAIIYPTLDANLLNDLYMRYMVLDDDRKLVSDNEAMKLFNKTNTQIYHYMSNKDESDNKEKETYKAEDPMVESSIFTNDLPLFTPKEYFTKIDEDYSCFNDKDAEVIKEWASLYALLGQGIKTDNYNKKNLERINILRRSIYENNYDAIIKCGWIPGVEFNSENRAKASQIIKEKMEVSNIIKYEDINESFLFDKNDFYYNFDKWENGESNVLLITGFSGSGKSTLARQLSKKYKCKHFCLDNLTKEMTDTEMKKSEPGLYDFKNKQKNIYEKIIKREFKPIEASGLYETYIKFLIDWCKKRKSEKFIIEGLQIHEIFNLNNPQSFYKETPIIIKGTSGLKSAIRGANRNSKYNDTSLIKELPHMIGWSIEDDRSLEGFKKYLSESYIEEASNTSDKKAVSLVFVAGSSILAKTIRKVQGTEFSHASISLDDDLDRIYSYNKRNGFNGFTYESVKNYINEGVTKMGVYTFLVSDNVYKSLEKVLDNFSLYINKTKYSILNLLTIPFNIPLDMDMKMVCSEFVDKLLKTANLDLTNKKSSLVGPRDLINASNTKSNIVEVFNDHPKKFKPKEVENKIKKLKRSNLPVYEFVEYDDEVITEAKSFPIQFDSDGNLLLKNIRKIDFEQEYSNSHRLLKEYDKTDSYEPMKFELAKMQFLITLLEKKIYKQGKDKSVNELKVRARFLNDFKKYLKIVNNNDPDFNFTEYYEQTPFNDAIIQIDKDTLKYGYKALKYIIKG